MLYRHSFRKKKSDYIPFLLKKPLKSSYNILKVERKRKRMGGERKDRKLSPRLNMIWMRPVSLILSCIFLYFPQYNQGPLVSFLFSKNKVPSFCSTSALLFLLCWPLTRLTPSLHVISLVRTCLTTQSDPYPQSLYVLPFCFHNTITIWKCFFVYLSSVFFW